MTAIQALVLVDKALDKTILNIAIERDTVEKIKIEFIRRGREKAKFFKTRKHWERKWKEEGGHTFFSPQYEAEHNDTNYYLFCERKKLLEFLQYKLKGLKSDTNVTLSDKEILWITDC